MSKLTRKQREIQEREAQILDVARQLFISEGYHGLSMEKIAAEMEYAKGTIYNHFPNKEEIMIALANEALQKRTEMFKRAASYPAATRDRLTAIGAANELFIKRFPNHFRVEQLIRSHSIWDKTSEKSRSKMLLCETACMGTVAGVMRDAVVAGDLVLPENTVPEDVVFGLWSMSLGAYSIISTSENLPDVGITDPYLAVRKNMALLVDGLGWKPLLKDRDYVGLVDTLQAAIFPEELAKLHAA
ncbi:MAG: TetR/AcrR family transcriptional regulator [Planctomycetota bacterium]